MKQRQTATTDHIETMYDHNDCNNLQLNLKLPRIWVCFSCCFHFFSSFLRFCFTIIRSHVVGCLWLFHINFFRPNDRRNGVYIYSRRTNAESHTIKQKLHTRKDDKNPSTKRSKKKHNKITIETTVKL